MKFNQLLILSFFFTIQLITVQGEIDFTLLDITTVDVNKEYISDIELYVNDGNEALFVNLTIIKEVPKSSTFTYELIGASMGEYIVKCGIKYVMPFCDIFKPNYRFLGNQFKMLGFREDACPPGPGIYGNENLVIDMNHFPDSFRRNQYVALVTIMDGLTTLLDCRIYFRIN